MLFFPKEKGQGFVEYVLILFLVVVILSFVLLTVGPIVGNVFSEINSQIVTGTPTPFCR